MQKRRKRKKRSMRPISELRQSGSIFLSEGISKKFLKEKAKEFNPIYGIRKGVTNIKTKGISKSVADQLAELPKAISKAGEIIASGGTSLIKDINLTGKKEGKNIAKSVKGIKKIRKATTKKEVKKQIRK